MWFRMVNSGVRVCWCLLGSICLLLYVAKRRNWTTKEEENCNWSYYFIFADERRREAYRYNLECPLMCCFRLSRRARSGETISCNFPPPFFTFLPHKLFILLTILLEYVAHRCQRLKRSTKVNLIFGLSLFCSSDSWMRGRETEVKMVGGRNIAKW